MKFKIVIMLILISGLGCVNKKDTKYSYESEKENEDLSKYTDEELVRRARELLKKENLSEANYIYTYLLKKGNSIYYPDMAEHFFTKKMYSLGIKYLDSGSVLGDANSARDLGVLYYVGKNSMLKGDYSVVPDIEKALFYYKIAANHNDPMAQFNVALIYKDSSSSIYNEDSAKYYLTKCINNNTPDENGTADVARKYFNEWYPNE